MTEALDHCGGRVVAGRALDVSLESIDIRDASELDTAFSHLDKSSVSGLLVVGSAFSFDHRARIAASALHHRLPALNAVREAAAAGGLMSYGPVVAEQFRQAAAYMDRILKDTPPSDLRVQQPAKFELVVNLKPAREIGVTVANSTLAQADEVIW